LFFSNIYFHVLEFDIYLFLKLSAIGFAFYNLSAIDFRLRCSVITQFFEFLNDLVIFTNIQTKQRF